MLFRSRVALLEHKDDIGKKILATGNGRCNFTNTDMSVNKFHGSKALIKNGLSQFNYSDTICFFKELGIPAYDNAGYIYPNSRQAASVVAAFRMELMRLHVDVKTGINITDIKPADDRTGYCIQTDKGSFKSKRLIIACGLTASPKLGSDGSLFRQIEALGHHIQKPLPALCGFSCDGLNFKKINYALSVTKEYLGLRGGPRVFPQGFSCLVVLWIPPCQLVFHVRGFHPLWQAFPKPFH